MTFKRLSYLSVLVAFMITPLIFLVNSCKHEGIPADQMPQIPFAQAQQVYVDYCIRCHHEGNEGIKPNLSTPSGIIASVTPGNSAKSESYQAMISTIQIMPPDLAVPAAKRTLVRLWIDQGASQQ